MVYLRFAPRGAVIVQYAQISFRLPLQGTTCPLQPRWSPLGASNHRHLPPAGKGKSPQDCSSSTTPAGSPFCLSIRFGTMYPHKSVQHLFTYSPTEVTVQLDMHRRLSINIWSCAHKSTENVELTLRFWRSGSSPNVSFKIPRLPVGLFCTNHTLKRRPYVYDGKWKNAERPQYVFNKLIQDRADEETG